MPDLFFTWIRRTDKSVHFEFLDNSVRLGERPRTVAFGDNDTLNLLDVRSVLNIERFRRVNVAATSPELLYSDRSRLAPEHNTGFLQRCVELFREVNFAEQATGRIYLRIEAGKAVATDREALDRAAADADTRAGVGAVAPAALADSSLPQRRGNLCEAGGAVRAPTLGQWGLESATGESACA
jgi:hypothetical protein